MSSFDEPEVCRNLKESLPTGLCSSKIAIAKRKAMASPGHNRPRRSPGWAWPQPGGNSSSCRQRLAVGVRGKTASSSQQIPQLADSRTNLLHSRTAKAQHEPRCGAFSHVIAGKGPQPKIVACSSLCDFKLTNSIWQGDRQMQPSLSTQQLHTRTEFTPQVLHQLIPALAM